MYAIYQVSLGLTPQEIGKMYRVSFKSVINWIHRFNKKGVDGLKNKPKSGRASRLTKEQKAEIKRIILEETPEKFGYNTATWTGEIAIAYIKKVFGLEYKKAQIYNIFRELNLTHQKGKGVYQEKQSEKRERDSKYCNCFI